MPSIDHHASSGSRIRRSEAPPAKLDLGALEPPRIRPRHDASGTVRREIDERAWTNEVLPKLNAGEMVTVRGATNVFVLRMTEGQLQAKSAGKGEFKNVTGKGLAQLKLNCSLDTPGAVLEEPTFDQKANPGQGFTVTEFQNEPLSLVHHTVSTGDDPNPHLTVENAHVLVAEDLLSANSATRDVRSKAGEDKSTINDALAGEYGVGSVDNLNFYQPEKPKGGKTAKNAKWAKADEKKTDYERLPLSAYLDFVAHALTVGGAPKEYGEKMKTFAGEMAREKHLDMSQLFLRSGMDEPALVRAVLIIDSVLPTGHKLGIDGSIRHVFERWWNVDGNEPKVPYLPAPEALDGPAIVRSGTQYENTTFSKLEVQYSQKFFSKFVDAIDAFVPKPEIVTAVVGKTTAKGKGQ